MKLGVMLLIVLVMNGVLFHLGSRNASAAESPETVDAFARLDDLAEEITAWQRSLGGSAGSTLSSVATPPTDAATAATQPDALGELAPSRDNDVLAGGVHGEVADCGSRHELAATITVLQDRYDEYGEAIIEVNDELPSLRQTVLDMERVCTERLTKYIGSALTRVEALAIAADYRIVETLTACVDRLRRETDEELSGAASNIRMQRLAVELELLGRMTHRVADLERALLRGISKRDRLVQELGQFQREIEAVCQ